ncbi:MAG: LacI family DNA-binding transcriptional regulator [Verrucomicrobia bacterium]|nr:LacI family DNA-binding transcriptional regulator [Verrucomicrobiota bacterium]
MKPQRTRLTLRDVAERAGVSIMTVSLALRDQPSLPQATRERIRALAAEMGYRPDPALAALNHYRAKGRRAERGAILAYLTAFETRDGWKQGFLQRTFEGARSRAEELGYRLEHFWLKEPGMTPQRMGGILQARGIRGVAVAPLPRPGRLEFPWEHFSAVAVGPSLVTPALHSACNNHYQSMLLALERTTAAGYRRIGLILDPEVDQRHQQKYLAAFTMFQMTKLGESTRLPPLLLNNPSAAAVRPWLEAHAPDVVLCHDERGLDWLKPGGAAVPEQMGFVSLIRGGNQAIAGIETFPGQIAAAAINRLNQLLHDNETGVPELPTCVMLNGSWMAGTTCKSKADAKA